MSDISNEQLNVSNNIVLKNLDYTKLNYITCQKNKLLKVTIKNFNNKNLIDSKKKYLIDFSTQSYLGFDWNTRIMNAQLQSFSNFGNVIAWSKLVAVPQIFLKAEQEIARLIGSEASSIFLSTTLLNHGVIPALAGNEESLILFEESSHLTMFEGALIAQAKGATLIKFSKKNLFFLENILEENSHKSIKLILIDGVNSMSGEYADLPQLDKIAKKYNALVYVDDAHGFGVIGEKPDHNISYGRKGNGLVKYYDLDYKNIIYVGCFSKAYGVLGAFIGCSKLMQDFILTNATPHDLGGIGPASAIFGLLEGLKINKKKGDQIRRRIYKITQIILDELSKLEYSFYFKTTDFPIITVIFSKNIDINKVCAILYDNNILITVEPYFHFQNNIVHLLRLTITTGISKEHIKKLIYAFLLVKKYLVKSKIST